MSDNFVPVTPGDVDDLHLLPRRFDSFAHEVRDSFKLLGEKILPAIVKFEHALSDIAQRLNEIEREQHTLRKAVTTQELRLAALEAQLPAATTRQRKTKR